jgi:GT2 family glycosyltransferase
MKNEKEIKQFPFVAIILVNYNGWKDTIECLESIFWNDYENYQVIVCDNASVNGSIEKIKDWANGKTKVCPDSQVSIRNLSVPNWKKPIPFVFYNREAAEKVQINKAKLIVIETGANLGFAGGNNVGIRYAFQSEKVDYIWLLNNDTVIERNALTEMVKLAENNSEIGIVGSKLLYYHKPSIIQNFGNLQTGWKGTGHSFLANHKDVFLSDIEVKSVIGASLLIKKKVVGEIGLLDEKYFMQDEESDWCVRASKAGYRIFSCAESRIYHKEGKSSNRSKQSRKIFAKISSRGSTESFLITGFYGTRNEIYFVRKNFPGHFIFFLLFILPYKLIRLILGIFVFRDDLPFLRIKMLFFAIIDGLRGKMGKTVDLQGWNLRVQNRKTRNGQ